LDKTVSSATSAQCDASATTIKAEFYNDDRNMSSEDGNVHRTDGFLLKENDQTLIN
jgi:hypothetical protein